ncbi:hypothetical protein EDI_054710 [Entamoeba dispar SAW760]|uniref:Uncharacterized protein n=1 Tax=Entamoeba dispar (strain ATCC PRA-260 / SAW760) TaxID=370354 RepID=B0EB59_ENTDS|nr:uncharacterized protein EDI_054710 [Entamoeba dispar SAW760]EDR28243.1 hypothetical protein EDI_054710 [Entamoeba dispar SAW760]|eukprot:EDR28243.1 hypothetical protein EDI_054710 [Entamoeba dispar SAW760]
MPTTSRYLNSRTRAISIMEVEDKISSTKMNNVKVKDLNDFFIDMFMLKDICDDFVELFRKEERYFSNEEKYNELLEEEAIMVDNIHNLTTEIKENYEEVVDAFYERRLHRMEARMMKAFNETEKKPRKPKEDNQN